MNPHEGFPIDRIGRGFKASKQRCGFSLTVSQFQCKSSAMDPTAEACLRCHDILISVRTRVRNLIPWDHGLTMAIYRGMMSRKFLNTARNMDLAHTWPMECLLPDQFQLIIDTPFTNSVSVTQGRVKLLKERLGYLAWPW